MAEITVDMIKELRARTGAGMMDCKRALEETGGDMDKAVDVLRKKGLAQAAKKASRAAEEGLVVSYIHHNNRVGVLLDSSVKPTLLPGPMSSRSWQGT